MSATIATSVPPVIVRPPTDRGPVEIAVHHREWGVEVDCRPAGTAMTWTPIQMVGGSFEVRSS